jgi:hypothetical protein
MDDGALDALRALDLPEVVAIPLAELEAADPELRQARETRSRVEYCYTCSPCLPRYLFQRDGEIDLLTYLDADLFFYSNPQPLFDELGDGSIGIIPHRFSRGLGEREKFGKYNVGWISFRRDANGLACLDWWREQCLDWCYARLEGDRYADQKYLDRWPELFQGVRELIHKGANLGPWNLGNYKITESGGHVFVDEQPLLFFHFSSFLQVSPWLYNTNLSFWHFRPSRTVRRGIAGPYIEALSQVVTPPTADSPAPVEPRPAESRAAWLRRKAQAVGRILSGLILQDHLIVIRGRVL